VSYDRSTAHTYNI